MYSYVGFLNGRLNLSDQEESHVSRSAVHHKDGDTFCGEPSFYACQNVFSTLTPDKIPQPAGKVISDDLWESLMRVD